MAMDKDRLLQYFQQHYLSRQEVLFKLPLNISIDTFWPELLNRRKAGATVLPLFNAAGMPYWYVLTDKMIEASEKLCAEAMELEESIDPYRTPMTSAMTEEMFFTSFVEGAQIPLQEAMDFLQRGTEPENIPEDVIKNADKILVMSVNPGRKGQTFRQETFSRIRKIRRRIKDTVSIEVDGGITDDNIYDVFRNGADRVVIGRALFQPDFQYNLRKFSELMNIITKSDE